MTSSTSTPEERTRGADHSQPSTSAPLPLSYSRIARAKALLVKEGWASYLRLKEKGGASLSESESNFANTDQFTADLAACFSYSTDYFPFYREKRKRFRPREWTYYVDIRDEVIEHRFPKDSDARDYITAYRISVIRNQLANIIKKRWFQFWASLLALAVPTWFAFDLGQWTRFDTTWKVGFLAGYAVMMFVVYQVLLYQLRHTTTEWKATFRSNASDLSSTIQNRIHHLAQSFETLQRYVSVSHTKTEDIESQDWLDHAKSWTQLAMWMAFRIDHIEQFLQSEMQRIRIFALWSDTAGNALSFAVWLICCGVVAGTALLVHGAHLTYIVTAWIAAGVILSGVFAWRTTRGDFSVSPTDIMKSVGSHDWSRFSDTRLDAAMGDLIFSAKKVYQMDMLRGGYGSGGGRRPPKG